MEFSCALALGIPALGAVRNAFLLFRHPTHVLLWTKASLHPPVPPACHALGSPDTVVCKFLNTPEIECSMVFILDGFLSIFLPGSLFYSHKTCLPWRSCADPPEVSSASVREFLEILCLCFSVVSNFNFTRLSRQLCCISFL